MEKIKENAPQDFLEMIKKSWTWERLNQKERKQFMDAFDTIVYSWGNSKYDKAIKGTYKDRWHILNAMYHMFLAGVGYDNNDPRWK